jgi:hypothetical protein
MQNQPSNVPTAKPKKPRLARRVAASFNQALHTTATNLLVWERLRSNQSIIGVHGGGV